MFTVQTFRSIGKALLTKKNPYYIQYFLTGRCNLKCRQCNIVETNSRVRELDLEHIKKVAKNLKKVGVGIVLLSGGEPFIRDDLPEIVSIFTNENLNVRLQTAGVKFATKQKLEACYNAGARDINVSLDSLDFLKSDYINATAGSGKNAVRTIEEISNIFRDKSAILSFGTVLSRFNYKEIPAILEFAGRIGWQVSLVPVHITKLNKPKGFRSYDNDFMFTEDLYPELCSILERIILMKKNGFPLFDSVRFLESSLSFLKGDGIQWRHKGVCDSPNLYFAVRPDGAFTTCCDYALENPVYVYDDTFVDAYKSGSLANREDVQGIINNCDGCHYGSYPEVTISVRDVKAFIEKFGLVTFSGAGNLKSALTKDNFLKEIKDIKNCYPEVYKSRDWLPDEINEKMKMWETPEGRVNLLKCDQEERVRQKRERKIGKDLGIGSK